MDWRTDKAPKDGHPIMAEFKGSRMAIVFYGARWNTSEDSTESYMGQLQIWRNWFDPRRYTRRNRNAGSLYWPMMISLACYGRRRGVAWKHSIGIVCIFAGLLLKNYLKTKAKSSLCVLKMPPKNTGSFLSQMGRSNAGMTTTRRFKKSLCQKVGVAGTAGSLRKPRCTAIMTVTMVSPRIVPAFIGTRVSLKPSRL